MSNASKLSQGSAALSAANRRVALNRKVNPILQPITSKQLDINSSKHSFSANNSVASEHEGDEVTLDEIEQLLSTTQTNLSEFTKEFKVITNSIMGQAPHSQPTKGFVLAKPDSGKGTRVTSNLDSMLTTTAINPIPKTASKVGFSIKSNRPQRSLSRNKK
jgi:hypothetical protein